MQVFFFFLIFFFNLVLKQLEPLCCKYNYVQVLGAFCPFAFRENNSRNLQILKPSGYPLSSFQLKKDTELMLQLIFT